MNIVSVPLKNSSPKVRLFHLKVMLLLSYFVIYFVTLDDFDSWLFFKGKKNRVKTDLR